MKNKYLGFVAVAALFGGLFAFQNCSNSGSFSTDKGSTDSYSQSSGVPVSQDPTDSNPTGLGSGNTSGSSGGTSSGASGGSSGGGTGGASAGTTGGTSGGASGGTSGGSSGGTIDALSCVRDYFTILPWANPNDDLQVVAPRMDSVKIKTIKIYSGVYPSTPASGPGWSILSYLRVNASTGAATTTTIIDKVGEDANDSMLCFLGADFSRDAQMSFENIGSGTLTGFVGYLSNSAKYIACKVRLGAKTILFQSADGSTFELQSNRPFILRRGCYQ